MKLKINPEDVNWFDVADWIASGRWDVAEVCRATGRSPAELKVEMARLGAVLSGSSFVRRLALDALKKIGEAEDASGPRRDPGPSGTPEPLPEPRPSVTLSNKGGAAAGGLALGKIVGVGLGVLAVGAGFSYWRGNRGVSPRSGQRTPAPIYAPASAPSPGGLSCTRGEAIVTQMGRHLASAAGSVSFTDPDTRIANTIAWEPPPMSRRVGDDIPLTSWSTHNGGRPMEVQWESGTAVDFAWGYGASSKDETRDEGRKITKLPFKGGSVRLKGGVNYGSDDDSFRMQWDYYCK